MLARNAVTPYPQPKEISGVTTLRDGTWKMTRENAAVLDGAGRAIGEYATEQNDTRRTISESTTGQDTDKRRISGLVLDEKGEPIIGANLVEKGTTNGTVTDIDGHFALNVSENAVLQVSYMGYLPQEVYTAGRNTFNIALKEDLKALDEVVVIGYGSVRRRDVTTAVSSISTDDLDERPIVSAVQAIQGKAAGVNVYQPSGTPGGDMVIRVRGTTSFNGSNSPLYVVDGVPVDNMNFLSPNDIADIQILKDASSAAIYGSARRTVSCWYDQAGHGGAKVTAHISKGKPSG